VWLGENKTTKEKVAMKVVFDAYLREGNRPINILQEIQILSNTDHPNIIKY
jgi:serine/threonine protein kinase